MSWREFEYVGTKLSDGVATVTISDPNDDSFVQRAHPMHRELRDIFTLLDDDPEVSVIVLAGGKHEFCPVPSLDLLDELLTARPGIAAELQAEARDLVMGMLELRKPLIAAVSKPAMGMGAQLAFVSDFLIASRDVTFRDSHVRLGLTSGDGATLIWPLLMGLARARRHILTGEPLTAGEAHEIGLVAELVERPEDVEAASLALAQKLATLPVEAYATTKRSLNGWLRAAAAKTLETAAEAQIATYESPEFLRRREAARRSRRTPTEAE
jgi:enoyl-CoA hydratase